MTKHTPGPWSCERDPCHFGTLSTVVGGDNSARKGISRQMIVHVGGWAEWREQEANARLIAAAPELLAALKAMFSESGVANCSPAADSPAERMARAAIAKAEGGQDE